MFKSRTLFYFLSVPKFSIFFLSALMLISIGGYAQVKKIKTIIVDAGHGG